MATSVDAKLLKSTKFPPEFNLKVDMQKVNAEVMKKWIASKISGILGNEDDVVIELCYNLIEGARFPDIKTMQIQLTGFLDKDTASFCKELWKLCLSAQSNPQGVPKELLEAKKLELIQEKIEAEKSAELARKRRDDEQTRERDINTIRNRERRDRGRGGPGPRVDSWRGGRGGRGDDRNRDFDRGPTRRDMDRRAPRYSRSPRRRPDSRDRSFRPPLREADTYVPRGLAQFQTRAPDLHLDVVIVHHPDLVLRLEDADPDPDLGLDHQIDEPHIEDGAEEVELEVQIVGTVVGDHQLCLTAHVHNLLDPPRDEGLLLNQSAVPHHQEEHVGEVLVQYRVPDQNLDPDLDISPTPDDRETGTPARKSVENDERRLTRSNSRSTTPPRRRCRSSTRSSSRGGRDRKRRRSMERYEPAKRRRNTSSVSSRGPPPKAKRAESDDRSDRVSPPSAAEEKEEERVAVPEELKSPQQQANELREKLLKEKIKKMRKSSMESLEKGSG
ncbi:hypothetical protein HYALB_00004804 [Hymenoscyphus albidus]|uniref:PWI domain-containing protein n=1 Tax=Hymenoscyphus albidus TaxID=595503 RepID=A0A9N9LHD8_9HELO|nr:hypothetical protein HYALB_00004804 [Hymenoscyphus albidus]